VTKALATGQETTMQQPHDPLDLILQQLRLWIERQQLQPGFKLPSERALAAALHVTRAAVRSSLVRLESEGVVHKKSHRVRTMTEAQARIPDLGHTVCVVTNITSQPLPDQDPNSLQVLCQAAAVALSEHGLGMLTVPPDRDSVRRQGRLLKAKPFGALVMGETFYSDAGDRLLRGIRANATPMVCYADTMVAAVADSAPFDTVHCDHRAGAAMLARWLIARGRRRILFLDHFAAGGRKEWWRRERLAGYRAALAEAGLEPLPEAVALRHARNDATRECFDIHVRATAGCLIEHIRDPRPLDAVMCISDAVVMEAAAALRLCGREPNRDVLLVGYDANHRESSAHFAWEPTAPLVTVDKRFEEVGRSLVALLMERHAGTAPVEPRRLLVQPRLIDGAQ